MNLVDRLHTYLQAIDPDTTIDVLPFVSADATPMDRTPSAADQASVSTPLLVCTAETFCPAPPLPGLEYVVISSESSLEDVKEGLDTNELGFNPEAPATSLEDAEAFRAQLATSRAFIAKLNNEPVAAGMFTPPVDGIAELVGITTLVPYRGRGIAAALTSEIVRVAFAHNVDLAFLRTDSPIAYRVYERIGFSPVAALISRRSDTANL
jgi:ribosomal protein S18 acetylase RimI-like enzyme